MILDPKLSEHNWSVSSSTCPLDAATAAWHKVQVGSSLTRAMAVGAGNVFRFAIDTYAPKVLRSPSNAVTSPVGLVFLASLGRRKHWC